MRLLTKTLHEIMYACQGLALLMPEVGQQGARGRSLELLRANNGPAHETISTRASVALDSDSHVSFVAPIPRPPGSMLGDRSHLES
jgi:hypothetical protein